MANPFDSAYTAIWNALNAYQGFTDLVRPGNRIDLSASAFTALKPEVAPADLPEVTLLQGAWSIGEGNSKAKAIAQTYQVIVTADTLRLPPLNQLKWTICRALQAAGADLGLPGLVRGYRVGGGSDDPFGKQEWSRGSTRWVAVASITVEMFVLKSDMTADESSTS